MEYGCNDLNSLKYCNEINHSHTVYFISLKKFDNKHDILMKNIKEVLKNKI